jgi:hypothetical protein
MIEQSQDSYDLKATVVPGLILALPLLVDAVYAAPNVSGWPIFAVVGTCSLALIYGLGRFARARGKAIEPELWRQWGGQPSTRLLHHGDSHFGNDVKAAVRNALAKEFSVKLPTPNEEATNENRDDQAIVEAFRQVRQYLRQHDPDGLWNKHNAEYGFCRNLLGCRMAWAVVALAATVFAATYAVSTGAGLQNPASAIGLLSFIAAVYIGWAILPDATKRIADGYAETAWMSFLRHILQLRSYKHKRCSLDKWS